MTGAPQEGRIALLDAEPDLGAGLSADEAALARRVVAARTLELDRGAWDADLGAGAVGAIVLSGLLAFGVALDGAGGLQLRGTGDVVLTQHRGGRLSGEAAAWAVAEPARLAVLDEAFVAATRRWPSLVEALLRRLSAQEEALACSTRSPSFRASTSACGPCCGSSPSAGGPSRAPGSSCLWPSPTRCWASSSAPGAPP